MGPRERSPLTSSPSAQLSVLRGVPVRSHKAVAVIVVDGDGGLFVSTTL